MLNVCDQFPFVRSRLQDIYLDSAATTQRPEYVTKKMLALLESGVSNIGRSNYSSAERWKAVYSESREIVKSFISGTRGELIFTSGFTEGSNLLATSLSRFNLKPEDEVLYTPRDHDSFTKPWLKAAQAENSFKLLPVERDGYGAVSVDDIKNSITANTKIILVTHGHNVSGRLFELSQLRKSIRQDIWIVVDGAQSMSHTKIECDNWGVDAFIFSGHKMFASFGVGGLWLSTRLFDVLQPVKFGGGGIEGPQVFEPGTPNLDGVLSLKLAVEYLNEIGIAEIEDYLKSLTKYLYENILQIQHVTLKYDIRLHTLATMLPIVSFSVENISASEVGDVLSENGIALRTGTMCTGITTGNLDGLVRASLHIYNTKSDIDSLIEYLTFMKAY